MPKDATANNPWLAEADKQDQGGKRFEDIRDLRFKDDNEVDVRIVPHPKPNQFPFYGYVTHWMPQKESSKNRPITHPIDDRCPVCEWISEQWREINRLKEEEDMTDKSPEVKKIYDRQGKVRGKKRYDMNVLDRSDMKCEKVQNEDGEEIRKLAVKRMAAPYNVYEEVFKCAKKSGSPSDPETGYDFTITTAGQGARRQYSVQPDRSDSPLTDAEKEAVKNGYELEKLRKTTSIEDMTDIIEKAEEPYTEILEHFEGYTQEEEKEEKEEEEKKEEKPKAKKEVKKEEPKKEEKEETPEEAPEETGSDDDSSDDSGSDDSGDDEASEDSAEDLDAGDLDNYECKGGYDPDDTQACNNPDDPCPVVDSCKKITPIYDKAKKLGIDVDNKRPVAEVMKEVKAKESGSKEEEQTGKRRRKKADSDESEGKAEGESKPKKKLPF